jgi:type I restriction enzyme R subunit
MAKTIVFCNDIDHADRMRRALVNLNPKQVAKNEKYVMKITGDDEIGKAQLDNFINPKKAYPVIATTSELMSTGVDAKTCKLVVLDQNIQSMTKFKQIIGRGTRIDDRYNKLWFTILDFKKATELFADEKFDGEAVKVMVSKPEDIIEDENDSFIDELTGDGEQTDPTGVDGVNEPEQDYDTGDSSSNSQDDGEIDADWGDDEDEKRFIKFQVSGVKVKKMAERVQYYDTDGKLVTESFKDYTRKTIQKQFTSLDDFTRKWNAAERKQTIIDELANEGVIWQALEDDISKELDPFDLICHIAFDQPPLTRQERANNVKKRNYFTKYSEQAQIVLKALLDKYADAGVKEIESIHVLKVQPFDQMGKPMEIAKQAFGNRKGYDQAITELETELYSNKVG